MVLTDAQIETLAALAQERFHEAAAYGAGGAFDDLPGELQEANRDSVRAIPDHLAALGYRVVVSGGELPVRQLDGDEVEQIARREHDRWADHTRSRGYRYGPTRDDVTRTHPDLVTWEQLDEHAREKDRAIARAIPRLLEQIGLTIVDATQ